MDKVILCVLAMFLLSVGCDEEKPRKTVRNELPDQQFTDSRMIITEKGITTAILNAHHVNVYEDRNYTVIEDSIKIEFFDNDGKRVSILTAQYGEIWGLYGNVDSLKATGNVVIVSEERNASMETPEILWIASTHMIYADSVRLSTEDAVEVGVEFEAADDLKNYTMKNVSGEIQGQGIELPER